MLLFEYITKKRILGALFVLTLAGAVYIVIKNDGWQWLTGLINDNTHPVLMLLAFLILPMLGFPISVFLILLGIRFGPIYGLLLMSVGFAVHLLVTFVLTHSYIRPWLTLLAERWHFTIPRMPQHRRIQFSFIFMAVPGLPYTVKNYLLALAGTPFLTYFVICWTVNGLMGAPFVVLSGAATRWALLLPLALLGVALLWFIVGRLVANRMKDLAGGNNRDGNTNVEEGFSHPEKNGKPSGFPFT